MSYYRYIDNGEGPTKLFIGGLHGNEGQTALKFLKQLKSSDFSKGQIYIYNFDKTEYITTLDEKYYQSEIGETVLDLITTIKPDFYIELHCYNIKNYKKLTSDGRLEMQGVPPLINFGDYVLVSSASPLIRSKYFKPETICKNLEFPCIEKLDCSVDFDFDKSFSRYLEVLKILASVNSRKEYERWIEKKYPRQVKMAVSQVRTFFRNKFSPF